MAIRYTNNIKIISDQSIQQWIVSADTVATMCSTAVVEAYAAKKNTLVLRPYELDEELDAPIYKGVEFVKNYDQFIEHIKDRKSVVLPEMEKYYDIQEKPTYMRICDVCEKIISSPDYNVVWHKDDLDEARDYLKEFSYTANKRKIHMKLNRVAKRLLLIIFRVYKPKTKRGISLKKKCNRDMRDRYDLDMRKKIHGVVFRDN